MKRTFASFDPAQYLTFDQGFLLPPRLRPWPRPSKGRPPEIKECIECAIHMASQIDLLDRQLSTHRPDNVRAAYFRSAMSELARVEDVLTSIGKQLPFDKSNDPSLHVIKLLRNYQAHIRSLPLSSGEILMKQGGDDMVYRSFITDDVTITELRRCRTSAYSDEQLNKLAELFNSSQRKLGLVQLLYHFAMRVDETAKAALKV